MTDPWAEENGASDLRDGAASLDDAMSSLGINIGMVF